ncbi:MAG: hypothetical protein HWD82_02780 [Flavobacteriaceae bacterium]|nr:hypothetical protein [Flavobacteriaceae bacterium]
MKSFTIIIIALSLTFLNLKSIRDLNNISFEEVKPSTTEIKSYQNFNNVFDWSIGFTFFKLLYVTELLLVSIKN